jgi:hypothetical protein
VFAECKIDFRVIRKPFASTDAQLLGGLAGGVVIIRQAFRDEASGGLRDFRLAVVIATVGCRHLPCSARMVASAA